MLAVANATEAAAWYKQALGATELWSLGSVVGLAIDGAPFFHNEPTNDLASRAGTTTVRVEASVDDPDTFIRRAIDGGGDGSADPVRDHGTVGHPPPRVVRDPSRDLLGIDDAAPGTTINTVRGSALAVHRHCAAVQG